MTKNKKRTSRFYQESTDLFETSDFTTPKTTKTKRKSLQKQAASAEQRSKRIVAKHTPVKELKVEEDVPVAAKDDLRDDWLQR